MHEKLTVAQLVKKVSVFNGTRRSSYVFIRASRWLLSEPDHSNHMFTPYFVFTSAFSILPDKRGTFKKSLLSGFPAHSSVRVFRFSNVCEIPPSA